MKMYKRNKYFEIIENSNFVDFNGVKKFMGNINRKILIQFFDKKYLEINFEAGLNLLYCF